MAGFAEKLAGEIDENNMRKSGYFLNEKLRWIDGC
jgi:hypothetical protein